ncbi:hypothetical protein [Sphingomonas xinjiangensis]|uniref:Uncharacterized protein n=1 Tax=Sphingomonas xinjiangensis TaxID=643568 RepID=A0A840YGA8_9SPHN|nr:hypothetical protein [Sphingomonas xinjiangensis]MBB5711335.1 hypothetical protein [Sphingomonas xinjiangensis]
MYKSSRDGVTVEVRFEVDVAKLNPARQHDSERIGQTDNGVIVLLAPDSFQVGSDAMPSRGQEAVALQP